MNLLSRMLVAVDGSEAATAALHFAMRCVQAAPSAALNIVSVFDRDRLIDQCSANPYVFSDISGILKSAEEACRDVVRDALADVRAARLNASSMLVTGAVVDSIVNEARGWRASCIVMGTHGRHGVARVFFGSVAEGVLRQSPCPVLTTHAARGEDYAVPLRILCALDDSPAARRAFDLATQAAIDLRCHLDLVSINEACSQIEALAQEARKRGVNAAVHVRHGRDIGAALISCAAVSQSGLIVLGTHGRAGFERAVLGSTAEHVIRASAVPVLVVRDPREVPGTRGDFAEAGSVPKAF